jgi:lysophospholipase L1-like esterase
VEEIVNLTRTLFALALLILVPPSLARAQCPPPAATVATIHPASRAEVRPDRQQAIRSALAAKRYDLITFGDSIMEGWSEARLSQLFGAPVLNAGFGQDGTEHLLWRLDTVDWHTQSPHTVLFLIGTNDIGYPSCDIFWGIRKVVEKAHALFPQARLIVTSVLPRGTNMLGGDERIRAVNSDLAVAAKPAGFTFFDAHDAFLCDHKTPCALFQPDLNLHLTSAGYDVLDARLKALLAQQK